MKRYAMPLKFAAFVMATVSFLVALFCGYGIITLTTADMYQDYPDSLTQPILVSEGKKLATAAATYFAATECGNCPDELLIQIYDELLYTIYNLRHSGDSNVVVTFDEGMREVIGEPIEDGIVFDDYQLTIEYPVLLSRDEPRPETQAEDGNESSSGDFNGKTYKQDIVVDNQIITCEYYYETVSVRVAVTFHKSKLNNTNYQLLSMFYPYRYTMIVGLAASVLLGATLTVYLLWVAGRDRVAQAHLVGPCRLPLDLYMAACIGLYVLVNFLFYRLVETVYDFHKLIFDVLCIALSVPLLLGFLYVLAAQSKQSDNYWLRHTVLGQILCAIGRGLRALFRLFPTIWQWLAIGFAMFGGTTICLIVGFAEDNLRLCMLGCLLCIASLALIGYGGYCFGVLLVGARKMAQGETERKIPEKYLFGAFKDCARQLNSLSASASEAMQSRIRAERMKTELITNVSHDIKTPLTSIINFVDLLEKPHTAQDEEQYLEVLSRQSQALKKLIEDLMELSRANTGNIAVNLSVLDAVEAASQALGEFADKFENAELTPVLRAPEEPMYVTADGRLMWRVLSNLLGNVVKYAAPNTRVYLDLTRTEDTVQLALRNISRKELNMTAEELLERFVRGDVSRNTEGSGLGLNIAKSLMEVQGGALELMLDGDLFKVVLTFPAAQ